MVDAVSLLRDRAENDEANVLYSLVNDLSKVSCGIQCRGNHKNLETKNNLKGHKVMYIHVYMYIFTVHIKM